MLYVIAAQMKTNPNDPNHQWVRAMSPRYQWNFGHSDIMGWIKAHYVVGKTSKGAMIVSTKPLRDCVTVVLDRTTNHYYLGRIALACYSGTCRSLGARGGLPGTLYVRFAFRRRRRTPRI